MMLDGARRLLEQETAKPKNAGATLRRFWPYLRSHWVGLLVVLVLMIFSAWAQVRAPQIIGQAVDCYLLYSDNCTYDDAATSETSTSDRLEGLGQISLELVVLYLASSVSTGLMFFTMTWAGSHAVRSLLVDTFNHMNRLSLGYYTRNEAGNLMSRFTSDAETIQQAVRFALIQVVNGSLVVFWIMYQMLRMNVPYALLSLTVVPFMIWATFYFSGQARKAFRRSRQEMGSVNANLQENIAGVREAQAFNRESENIERFRETNAANRDANVRAAAYTSALTPVLEALGYIAIAIVVVVGGISILRNDPLFGTTVISFGMVVAFLQYVQRFNQPIQQIALVWTNLQSAIAGGERIFNLLDETPDITDKPNAKPMPQIRGKVEFINVVAGYEDDQPVLKGVNFTAESGQMVAIVGPTGAGKTTLINLIPRFYDVSNGVVKIDGMDVRDVQAESLRSQIGIVLQDSFLFSDTVMNNIRYGRLNATDEEVIAAAKLAYADDFINRLPEGYQTVLGERGSGLSQGQRQLLSIARAALASPRILILDEATSSVDTRTEKMIQRAFEQLLENRTSFVIAHRLSTIRNADVVLMIQDGLIIERGTHDELLAKQGAYYDLYMSQFQAEEVPV